MRVHATQARAARARQADRRKGPAQPEPRPPASAPAEQADPNHSPALGELAARAASARRRPANPSRRRTRPDRAEAVASDPRCVAAASVAVFRVLRPGPQWALRAQSEALRVQAAQRRASSLPPT